MFQAPPSQEKDIRTPYSAGNGGWIRGACTIFHSQIHWSSLYLPKISSDLGNNQIWKQLQVLSQDLRGLVMSVAASPSQRCMYVIMLSSGLRLTTKPLTLLLHPHPLEYRKLIKEL